MTETIGNKLNEIISPIVPFFLSEAETSDYPYSFYKADVTPYYNKDGIYRFRSVTSICVVSNDFDEADTIANAIDAAIHASMTGNYSSMLQSRVKDCLEGVWTIELNYIINQR